jgi:uncharacterized membrane protein (DUF4010 family)
MEPAEAFRSLGVALMLGLLVGMQRERVEPRLAGIRTFALITLLGALSALAARALGGWIVGAALAGVAAAMVVGNLYTLKKAEDEPEPGITTEIAILAMFAVGAYVVVGPREVAAAAGAAVAILLHAKKILHGVVAKMGDQDVRAIMQFVLISFVILPVVPDQTYGPYDVLNPRQVWLMVVLVVGLSLAGYVAYKFVGGRGGLALSGLLGGVVSSTATTVSSARQTKESPAFAPAAAMVIVLAGGVVFVRLMAEISVAAPGFFPTAAGPLGVMLGVALTAAAVMWLRVGRDGAPMDQPKNPAELKSALVFGGIYAVVLLAVAAARDLMGDRGLYAVAAVSGLTDMDAITLSSARLVASGQLDAGQAWRAIILASMSNIVFKTVLAGAIGGWALLRLVAPAMVALLAAGAGLLVVWGE